MNFVVHPQVVQTAHLYGCAAAKQGKFLAYKHAFWEKGFDAYAASGGRDKSSMGEGNILQFAPSIGLDVNRLKADAHSPACTQRLAEDAAELAKFHVSGTPGFFINGTFVGGGIPKEAFKQIIDQKLELAKKSGLQGAAYYQQEIEGKGLHEFRSKADARKEAEAAAEAAASGSGSDAGSAAGSAAGSGGAEKP